MAFSKTKWYHFIGLHRQEMEENFKKSDLYVLLHRLGKWQKKREWIDIRSDTFWVCLSFNFMSFLN